MQKKNINTYGILWFEYAIALMLFVILFSLLIIWLSTLYISLTKSYQILTRASVHNTFQEFFIYEMKHLSDQLSSAIISNDALHIVTHEGKKVYWHYDGSSLLRTVLTTDKNNHILRETSVMLPQVKKVLFSFEVDHINKRIVAINLVYDVFFATTLATKKLTVYIRKGALCI